MQITASSNPDEVVATKFAKRLIRQIIVGAMLIGIAPSLCGGIERACAATAKPKTVKVWKFLQRTTQGHGVLLISDSAIKYTFTDQNVYWLASAPTWNVCVLNTKKNLGTIKPLSFATGRVNNSVEFGKIHNVTKSSAAFMHRPALKAAYDVTASDPINEKAEMFYQTGSERGSAFSKAEGIFSNWFVMAPQVQDVLNGITTISICDGVLLEDTHLYPGGRKITVLATGSVTQCEVPVSEFAYPKGFTEASLRVIMQEKERAIEMSDVIQDLFFDDKKK